MSMTTNMVWTPEAIPYDSAANVAATTARTEASADRDF